MAWSARGAGLLRAHNAPQHRAPPRLIIRGSSYQLSQLEDSTHQGVAADMSSSMAGRAQRLEILNPRRKPPETTNSTAQSRFHPGPWTPRTLSPEEHAKIDEGEYRSLG